MVDDQNAYLFLQTFNITMETKLIKIKIKGPRNYVLDLTLKFHGKVKSEKSELNSAFTLLHPSPCPVFVFSTVGTT